MDENGRQLGQSGEIAALRARLIVGACEPLPSGRMHGQIRSRPRELRFQSPQRLDLKRTSHSRSLLRHATLTALHIVRVSRGFRPARSAVDVGRAPAR